MYIVLLYPNFVNELFIIKTILRNTFDCTCYFNENLQKICVVSNSPVNPPLSAIIIRANRQMDSGWLQTEFRVTSSSDINHFQDHGAVTRGRCYRVTTLPVSTRGIYKVSPCDNHKMDKGIQSGCLYLDFRSLGVKVTQL